MTTTTTTTVRLHGNQVSYLRAGSGPLLVLVHGITGGLRTWEDVVGPLAEHHTVLAPDLLGHGASAKPRGDYSLGAFASGIRDLLTLLGLERGTIVGHSMGGGIALQFAYQFPERCDRLVLVGSGGLGREVSPVLRAASLPGAEFVLPVVTADPLRRLADAAGGVLGRLGLRLGVDLEEQLAGWASLTDAEARSAFVHTLRGLIDARGQRVSAVDRLYLAAGVPTLFVWGDRDSIIPLAHAEAAAALVAGSRLEVFEGAGHFPHRSDPQRFAALLRDFVATTTPGPDREPGLRELLRNPAS